MKSRLPRGLILDRGYLFIRIRVPGSIRPHMEGCGPDTPKNRQAGAARLAQLRESIRLQRFHLEEPERRIPFHEAAGIFEEKHVSKLPGVSTAAGLRHIKSFFGTRYFDTITYLDARAYRREREKVVSSATVNRELGVLRTMYHKLRAWSRIRAIEPVRCPPENPLLGAPMSDERPRSRRRLVSPEEFQKILEVSHPATRRIALGALMTLLRSKDLRALTKSKHWDPVSGFLRGVQAKTGKPYEVPVGPRLRQLIESSPADHIFDFENFRRRWTIAVTAAGCPDVILKDLRRTGARAMLAAGVDIAVVSKLLGHTSLEMTQRYVAAPVEDLRMGSEKLENFVNLPSEKLSYGKDALVAPTPAEIVVEE